MYTAAYLYSRERACSFCLMTAAIAPPVLSKLLHMLPAACVEECGSLEAKHCSDTEHGGALAVYGQWSSCSTFSSPLQQCVNDADIMVQLVAAAHSSREECSLQLLLILASASVACNTANASVWLDAGIYHCLTRGFTQEQSAATRKLAFDLAFVIVNSRLRIEPAPHDDCPIGFGLEDRVRAAGGAGCESAAREFQVASLFAVRITLACHSPFICAIMLLARCCSPPSRRSVPRTTHSCPSSSLAAWRGQCTTHRPATRACAASCPCQ